MKLADVNSSTYIDFNAKNNDKDSKFKVGKYKKHKKCKKYE